MNTVFFGFVVFLMLLAIFDLIVGVSNDAVNFLNSAVGAKVAPLRVILIVASIGIMIGASMSNGMIDIARNGIFKPDMFSFLDIMFILIAVMVADIILLDIFNNMGLPTSTTVSMVFELLGGTFALSMIKIMNDNSLSFSDLMNSGKALSIIISIFLSVAIAFFFGGLIQWISRILFTFAYKNKLSWWKVALFGGLATTSILYFMLIKGMKNFELIPQEVHSFIADNALLVVSSIFLISATIIELLHLLKINIFKILILLGTFALAMAFAGNDLVNFIGVPLSGYSAYLDFTANGNGDAEGFLMKSLTESANTPIIFLLGAGLVMIIALASSKKAKNVVKTSVDLARQGEGDEMFGSSKMARIIVRLSTDIANNLAMFIPDSIKQYIDKRFSRENIVTDKSVAFDEIRATTNLVVASLLIALGTSLKLPLSTTYVTFMVAMGTSLADKAWGRESAVFRITGVLSVIAGWFITAGAAFTLCFLIALIMKLTGVYITIAITILAILLLLKSNLKYKKKSIDDETDHIFEQMRESSDKDLTYSLLVRHMTMTQSEFIQFVNDSYKNITDGFLFDKLSLLAKSNDSIRNERVILKNIRRKEMIGLRLINEGIAIEKNTWFHLVINGCEDALFSLRRMCDSSLEHIDNTFVPLSEEKVKKFIPLRDTVLFLISRIKDVVDKGKYDELNIVYSQCNDFVDSLKTARTAQIEDMQKSKDNITVSYVYLNMLQESETLVTALKHLLRAIRHFSEDNPTDVPNFVEGKTNCS